METISQHAIDCMSKDGLLEGLRKESVAASMETDGVETGEVSQLLSILVYPIYTVDELFHVMYT